MDKTPTDQEIKQAVRQNYGDIARRVAAEAGPASCCGPAPKSSCCGPSKASTSCGCSTQPAVETLATGASLYPAEKLAGLPDSVTDASLGCGDPTAIADLKPGEVVLDLGSGGGIDCFLAAQRVGPTGRVIGLDMTPEMLKLAQHNAKKLGARNVEFRYGEMEDMPLPDASVDVIISNCVVNLSPDKDAVFKEAYRVLRPGGRLSISDMVVNGDLPASVRVSLNAWASCIAGALDEQVYLDKMRAAGFQRVEVASRASLAGQIPQAQPGQLLVVQAGDQVLDADEVQAALAGTGLSVQDVAAAVASIRVTAYKPGA